MAAVLDRVPCIAAPMSAADRGATLATN